MIYKLNNNNMTFNFVFIQICGLKKLYTKFRTGWRRKTMIRTEF